MNDEIREILDKLKDDDWYDELDLTGDKWIELKQTETKQLLDYITNLQQEIEKLNEDKRGMLVELYKLNDTKDKIQDEYEKIIFEYLAENCGEFEDEHMEHLVDLKVQQYINLQQENERLKERVAYLERSNNRREDTILGLRQEISDAEDCNDELKKKLDKTLEVLQYELQFQTGGCYYRLSNLFDYLQNGSEKDDR